MVSNNFCHVCGAAVSGRAVCSACGTPVMPPGSRSPAVTDDATMATAMPAGGLPPGPTLPGLPISPDAPPYTPSGPPSLPRSRVALLLLNVALGFVAVTLLAWNMLDPVPPKQHPTAPLAAPTATNIGAATDAPVYTVSVTAPKPTSTSTPTGQGGPPPPLPTATPRAHPTATPTPTATLTPVPPTPTATLGSGG